MQQGTPMQPAANPSGETGEYDILEHDILLNTTQTVLCLPGVAYPPDSVLSVIN